MLQDNDSLFIKNVKEAYENIAKHSVLVFKNNFLLHRGPYTLIAVMEEGVNTNPYVYNHPSIDLINPELPIVNSKVVEPGKQAFLYDLRLNKSNLPKILAAASRNYEEQIKDRHFSFISKSPSNSINAMRIFLPFQPKNIKLQVNGNELEILKKEWDIASHTLLLKFRNYSNGVIVDINW